MGLHGRRPGSLSRPRSIESRRARPAMAAPGPDPNDVARQRVAESCDALVQRVPFKQFSEPLGSVDYARWRRELVELASSAGPDFTAALLFKHDIPAPPAYPLAAVLLDTAAGGVVLSMPQMRQAALLSCIRAALDPNG